MLAQRREGAEGLGSQGAHARPRNRLVSGGGSVRLPDHSYRTTASAVRALRRTLLRAFRRPGAQALGSWRALGPTARVPGGVAAEVFWLVASRPRGGPAHPLSAVARRVVNGVFSGSSPKTFFSVLLRP